MPPLVWVSGGSWQNTIAIFQILINTTLRSEINFLPRFVMQYLTNSWCHWKLFVCKLIVLYQAIDGTATTLHGFRHIEVYNFRPASCASCRLSPKTSGIRINSGRCHRLKSYFFNICTQGTESEANRNQSVWERFDIPLVNPRVSWFAALSNQEKNASLGRWQKKLMVPLQTSQSEDHV